MSPAYEDILVDISDNVMTITLNRPEKLNAFSAPLRESLHLAFDEADTNDDVRAIIVTGAGRGFCAGADLSGGEDTFNYEKRKRLRPDGLNRDGGGVLTLRIFESKKPVIAAVNGTAGWCARFWPRRICCSERVKSPARLPRIPPASRSR